MRRRDSDSGDGIRVGANVRTYGRRDARADITWIYPRPARLIVMTAHADVTVLKLVRNRFKMASHLYQETLNK